MKKKCLLLFLAVLLLPLFPGAAVPDSEESAASFKAQYETLHNNLTGKIKTTGTRDAYKKLMKAHSADLEILLEKLKKAAPDDEVELLKGRVLFDLGKTDAAMKVFENLVKNQSPAASRARFEQVRLLLEENKINDAAALFRQVEEETGTAKGKNYFQVLLELAFSSKEIEVREEYSYKFIKAVENLKEYEGFKAMMYNNLGEIEKEKGNLKGGIELLEKALTEFTSEKEKGALKSALKRLKMIGTPAPGLSAETWINSEGMEPGDLKGKTVIIHFWAPWCTPCRQMIPALIKNFNQYKEKGLLVIGFTRIYGRYSDDMQNKGDVPVEEEKKLIKEFVQRHKIPYPVAAADTGTVSDMYGVREIPTMFLVDKEGNVIDLKVGSGDLAGLEEKIKNLLQ